MKLFSTESKISDVIREVNENQYAIFKVGSRPAFRLYCDQIEDERMIGQEMGRSYNMTHPLFQGMSDIFFIHNMKDIGRYEVLDELYRNLFKVIIAGSRTFSDYRLLERKCNYYLQKKEMIQIVSGGAPGADQLGERYAIELEYLSAEFHADWDNEGKSAGPKRNQRMADYADALIAFWDGQSRGTLDMINRAKKKGLKVKIVRYLNS